LWSRHLSDIAAASSLAFPNPPHEKVAMNSFAARAGSAVKAFAEASSDLLIQPTLRLGVTGLARSGKTVFTP
jgi:hypothetical protein